MGIALFLPLNLQASLAELKGVNPQDGLEASFFGRREMLLNYEAPASQRDFYRTASLTALCLTLYFLFDAQADSALLLCNAFATRV